MQKKIIIALAPTSGSGLGNGNPAEPLFGKTPLKPAWLRGRNGKNRRFWPRTVELGGQLAFFAEFLEVSGLFVRWANNCPVGYTSNNAPDMRDILGTW